jgi:hypothetical protein
MSSYLVMSCRIPHQYEASRASSEHGVESIAPLRCGGKVQHTEDDSRAGEQVCGANGRDLANSSDRSGTRKLATAPLGELEIKPGALQNLTLKVEGGGDAVHFFEVDLKHP